VIVIAAWPVVALMTSKILFQPLYGAKDTNQPLSFLLRVDDFTILLDCGWNDSWDVALLEPLTKYVLYRITRQLVDSDRHAPGSGIDTALVVVE
jgi:hypothetical protein